MKRVFFWHWTLLGARDAQRGLKPPWLCCDSPESSHRVSFSAALLSPEPRGQPELSPQERVELQKLHFPSRSALTHQGESAHPNEKFPSVYGGQEQGKESAGQDVDGVGVHGIWALQWGQAEDRDCLKLHTASSEIPAFSKQPEKSTQQDTCPALMYWDPPVQSPEYSPGSCGSLTISLLSKDQVTWQQGQE